MGADIIADVYPQSHKVIIQQPGGYILSCIACVPGGSMRFEWFPYLPNARMSPSVHHMYSCMLPEVGHANRVLASALLPNCVLPACGVLGHQTNPVQHGLAQNGNRSERMCHSRRRRHRQGQSEPEYIIEDCADRL